MSDLEEGEIDEQAENKKKEEEEAAEAARLAQATKNMEGFWQLLEKENEGNSEDDSEDRVPLEKMDKITLRLACFRHNLDYKGKKAELVDRLKKHLIELGKYPPEPPDKLDDDSGGIDPDLELIEKKINEGKSQKERKEEQLKKVGQQLKKEAKKIAELEQLKRKLLTRRNSSVKTEDFKQRIKDDIEKRKIKKELFQDDEDDRRSRNSEYSQAWSLFR